MTPIAIIIACAAVCAVQAALYAARRSYQAAAVLAFGVLFNVGLLLYILSLRVS